MRCERRRDDGMVTAELAACLPVLVLVLAMSLTAVSAVSTSLRVQDAASEGARAAARGDRAAVAGMVRRAAPGARVTLSRSGDAVVAVVSAQVHALGGVVPSFTVTARAVSALEPTGTSPGVIQP